MTERRQEVILGALAILWGLLLLLPDDVFGRIGVWASMSRYLPDWMWGILLIASGLTLIGLLPIRLRKEANAVLAFIWSFVVFLVLLSGLRVTTVLIAAPFAAIALLHIFEYFRLSQLARY